ncbi:MAG: hypothetical protein ACKO7N_00245, partial [Candidatus Nitrosotenuis sp.]
IDIAHGFVPTLIGMISKEKTGVIFTAKRKIAKYKKNLPCDFNTNDFNSTPIKQFRYYEIFPKLDLISKINNKIHYSLIQNISCKTFPV